MSRRRQISIAGVVLSAFVLQIAVMPQFKILGVQPNLMLVVAVVVAVQEGPMEGAVVGFCGGLLVDLVSYQVLGVGAFTTAATAFMSGMMKDIFMTYSILLPIALVLIMSILEPSLRQATLLILGQEELPPFKVLTVIFPSALYNALAVLVVYPVMRRLSFPAKEESMILPKAGI